MGPPEGMTMMPNVIVREQIREGANPVIARAHHRDATSIREVLMKKYFIGRHQAARTVRIFRRPWRILNDAPLLKGGDASFLSAGQVPQSLHLRSEGVKGAPNLVTEYR
jgi:DNA helicase HerA-like ATPase